MSILEGFTVVELGVWIAGPAAAGVLADWGADVIKVETAVGDPQRHVLRMVGLGDARLPAFEVDNRGKRSVVLDLKSDEGRADMMRLLAEADVFVTNLRLKALHDLGLLPDELRSQFPSLVYGLVTGYGSVGPDAGQAGYDVGAFWARSGAAAGMMPKGESPPGLAPSFGDHVTGMTLVSGICAALAARSKSGEGALVETSLLRSGMYCMAADLSTQLLNGRSGRMLDRSEAPSALMNSYADSEGRYLWLLCLDSDRHWPDVCVAIDQPELEHDERYSTAVVRYKNRRELIAHLDLAFAARTRDDWATRLNENGVFWTPMNTAADVLEDPQVQAAHGFVEIPASGHLESITSVSSPVDFNGQRPLPRRASPQIGEHGAEIAAAYQLETRQSESH